MEHSIMVNGSRIYLETGGGPMTLGEQIRITSNSSDEQCDSCGNVISENGFYVAHGHVAVECRAHVGKPEKTLGGRMYQPTCGTTFPVRTRQ